MVKRKAPQNKTKRNRGSRISKSTFSKELAPGDAAIAYNDFTRTAPRSDAFGGKPKKKNEKPTPEAKNNEN